MRTLKHPDRCHSSFQSSHFTKVNDKEREKKIQRLATKSHLNKIK